MKRKLARLLQTGIAGGALLLIAGTIIAASTGELVPGFGLGVPGMDGLLPRLIEGDPAALLRAGVLVVLLTPVARVVAVSWMLRREKDVTGAVCALVVLLLVTVAILLDLTHD